MITARDEATMPDGLETAKHTTPRSGNPRLRLVAGILIVALSTIGIVMLGLSDSTGSAVQAIVADESSSLDFLQPVGGDAGGGPARLRYATPQGSVAISNGGSVPLTDDLQLEVAVRPYPPTSFDIEVDLRLTTTDGVPVDDADIRASWDMVFMYHGPFETRFDPIGDGYYTASFDFFMFGPWELVTQVNALSHQPPGETAVSVYVWPE